jgi:hypothetical protein
VGSDETSFEATREALHRVAAHVLGRRRWDVSGRFGLRVAPGGMATPMFGTDGECIRIAGTTLVREVGAVASFMPIPGASLRSLAEFVDADIGSAFSSGNETPEIGDPDQPIQLDSQHVETIATWYGTGAVVMDTVTSQLPGSAQPATVQLWPEHFDIGTDVGLANGSRVNLGCSPGDSFVTEPYLYVGPWDPARPGDPSYWNVSFGAALRSSEVLTSADPIQQGVQFMTRGLDALSGR